MVKWLLDNNNSCETMVFIERNFGGIGVKRKSVFHSFIRNESVENENRNCYELVGTNFLINKYRYVHYTVEVETCEILKNLCYWEQLSRFLSGV